MVCWSINFPNTTNFIACSGEAAKWLFPKNVEKSILLKNGIEYEQFSFSNEIRKQVREELNF